MAGTTRKPPAETENPASDGWTTVQEESPAVLVFENPGDQFVGRYIGPETVTPEGEGEEPFTRYTFRAEGNPAEAEIPDGTLVAINSSWRVESAMGKVEPGDLTRITYTKDIKTKRGLNPLKDFRVDVKR